jgi:hypothetical protein
VRLRAYASADTRCARKGKANAVSGRTDEGNLTAGFGPDAPAAGLAGNRTVPKTPASLQPSAERCQNAAPLPAGSHLQSEPHIEPEHRAPRPSSPGPCRFPTKAICSRFFTTRLPGRFGEGSLRGRLQPDATNGRGVDFMRTNQRVSAPRCSLLTASTARYARFAVGEDAGRSDPGFKPSGSRGISP